MTALEAVNYLNAINSFQNMVAYPKTQRALFLGSEALMLLTEIYNQEWFSPVYLNQHPTLKEALTGGLKQPRKRHQTISL